VLISSHQEAVFTHDGDARCKICTAINATNRSRSGHGPGYHVPPQTLQGTDLRPAASAKGSCT